MNNMLQAIKHNVIFEKIKWIEDSEQETAKISKDEFDWLIDRAERYDEVVRDAIKLHDENKHYREHLKYMLDEAKDHKKLGYRIQHWALIKDLERALEVEE